MPGPENAHEDHDHDHDHEEDDDLAGLEEILEVDAKTQVYLEARRQNIDLLKLAIEMTGFSGPHPALKPNDAKNALKTLWDVYAEFYSWIDPDGEDDDEEGDDEDDE